MPALIWLNPYRADEPFPEASLSWEEPNGLLAAGGDLSLPRLTNAYREGIFPWYSEGQPILWWTPNPRLVLFPDELKISRSLRKSIRNLEYQIRFDSAFAQVIRACSDTRAASGGTWILPEVQMAYLRLHEAGLAHCIEVWRDEQLVGGLYGVAMGKIFFGESMFHKVTDASKIALVYLVAFLKSHQFALIDCQVRSNHLISLGAREISRDDFLVQVKKFRDVEAVSDWPRYLPRFP